MKTGSSLVGVEREVVVAHPGHERHATELEFSLEVRAGFDDVALGKYLVGKIRLVGTGAPVIVLVSRRSRKMSKWSAL